MVGMEKKQGKIIRDPHINVWPHEMRTAEALAGAGYTVEFIKVGVVYDLQKRPNGEESPTSGAFGVIRGPGRYASYFGL